MEEKEVKYCEYCHRLVNGDTVIQRDKVYHLECWKQVKNCHEELTFE